MSRLSGIIIGSIPACAGEPFVRWARVANDRVYPRVCGGTASGRRRHHRLKGLSPRVRGNLYHAGQAGAIRGSIPACAGEPAAARSPLVAPAVYPRVCGGT